MKIKTKICEILKLIYDILEDHWVKQFLVNFKYEDQPPKHINLSNRRMSTFNEK